MKRIFFTGGGTAGHVTPNIALIERMLQQGWEVHYIGSKGGIEESIVAELPITFHGIATGKLRRYFSWQNFLDPLKILFGLMQSLWLCIRLRPSIVFSKGGFVAVPIVIGAWLCRVPVIAHESDITPGLANKLCFPFVRYVCVNFQETEKYLGHSSAKTPGNNINKAHSKVIVTGSPVRTTLVEGDAERGRAFLGFSHTQPILLVFGGSLGAQAINDWVWGSLTALLARYQVVHIVGAGNINTSIGLEQRAGQTTGPIQNSSVPHYCQKEFLQAEFGDVLAAADLVLSRAGANSIYELLLMRKPHILVPLTARASRGDQIINARIFESKGMSQVVDEDRLTSTDIVQVIEKTIENQSRQLAAIANFEIIDSVSVITELLERTRR